MYRRCETHVHVQEHCRKNANKKLVDEKTKLEMYGNIENVVEQKINPKLEKSISQNKQVSVESSASDFLQIKIDTASDLLHTQCFP